MKKFSDGKFGIIYLFLSAYAIIPTYRYVYRYFMIHVPILRKTNIFFNGKIYYTLSILQIKTTLNTSNFIFSTTAIFFRISTQIFSSTPRGTCTPGSETLVYINDVPNHHCLAVNST